MTNVRGFDMVKTENCFERPAHQYRFLAHTSEPTGIQKQTIIKQNLRLDKVDAT
jgi:hypothetical protein